jgi:hypothetical protein
MRASSEIFGDSLELRNQYFCRIRKIYQILPDTRRRTGAELNVINFLDAKAWGISRCASFAVMGHQMRD